MQNMRILLLGLLVVLLVVSVSPGIGATVQDELTITSVIYLKSEQLKANTAILLGGVAADNQQRLTFTATAVQSTWFGTAWRLSLDYHSPEEDLSLTLLERTRLLRQGREYEAVLSFDQNTGECAVRLVDLTAGEEIFQGFAFVPWVGKAFLPLAAAEDDLPIEVRQWEVSRGYKRLGKPVLLENVYFQIHGTDATSFRLYSTEEAWAEVIRTSGPLPGVLRGVVRTPGPWEGRELFSHPAAEAEFSTQLTTSLVPGRYEVALEYCLEDYVQEVARTTVDVIPPHVEPRIFIPLILGEQREPVPGEVAITSDVDLQDLRLRLTGIQDQRTITLLDERIALTANMETRLSFTCKPLVRSLQLSIWSEKEQMEPINTSIDWPFLAPNVEPTQQKLTDFGLKALGPWQELIGSLFVPEFTVLYRSSNPGLRFRALDHLSYSVPTWVAPGGTVGDVAGFLPHEFEQEKVDMSGQTRNLFVAAESSAKILASKAHWKDGVLALEFAPNPAFDFSAEVIPLDGPYEVALVFQFTPKQSGWYSIGYTGAPKARLADVDSLWQPLVWQELRFPDDSYLTTEFNCPLPTTFVTIKDVTIGVMADPEEMPFRLPTATNSRFGVALRNPEGLVQSMLFAPVLGGPESYMQAGQTYTFRLRLFAYPGDWLAAYEYVARNAFDFADYRINVGGSLNDTLENMITYALDDHYSGWDAEHRGSSYKTDVPGSVKNISALHPLSMAFVTDREEIYHRRALPIMEFFFSRQKSLFALEEGVTGQGATHVLAGPAYALSELVALYHFSQGRSPIFSHFAEEMYNAPYGKNANGMQLGKSWENSLAMYRLTGDPAYLEAAIEGANRYIADRIDRPQRTFGGSPFFWNNYSPEFFFLLELYEETKDPKHLEAAVRAARLFSTFIWMAPRIPDTEILVNPGGKASKYWYARGPEPMDAPEEMVPAWRLSEIGLTAESSGTAHGHRAIFMANHAAYFLRLAHYGDDPFLRDVGRAAIVGRYLNFPGYHMNTERSTVYEKVDYPYHEHEELTYNTFHYNHIWPHISLLFDFMVSDVFDRSRGQISFPSEFAEGYGYVRSKVYGSKPGSFYGHENVWLYMPLGLLHVDHIQVNYIAARDEDTLYVALTNSSNEPVTTTVTVNQEVLPLQAGTAYPVDLWVDNQRQPSLTMEEGRVTVTLSPKGITALAIRGVKIETQFQSKLLDSATPSLSEESFTETKTPYGLIRGMLLRFGRDLTTAYIYTEAQQTALKEVTLEYRIGEEPGEIEDFSFPFEFTVPVPEDTPFQFRLKGIRPNGELVEFPWMTLVP